MSAKAYGFVLGGVLALVGLFYFVHPEPPGAQATNDRTGQGQPVEQHHATEASTKGAVFPIQIQGRHLVSGSQLIEVRQGTRLKLVVTSDQAEELHLHGYNLKRELLPNQPATLEFTADRSGRFEYELEKAGVEIGVLEVSPQ